MRFGIFYEHQLPRPWHEGDELRLFQHALDQVELADKLGIDNAWEVEHHFLEEYSHSSAPEVFLAACSQRTKNIRLGHGITLMPPNYNHPARVAERIATLDLVSNGRVEWGTGESSAQLELGGYRVPVEEKRSQWQEAVEQALSIGLAMTAGYMLARVAENLLFGSDGSPGALNSLARSIVSVVAPGGNERDLKARIESFQHLLATLMVIATTLGSIYAGVKSVLN